ncbi:MAG: DsbA family protein [Candidatus Spechtbacterales bacterium]
MEEEKKLTKKEKYELKKQEQMQQKEIATKNIKQKSLAMWIGIAGIVLASIAGIVYLAANKEPSADVKLANEIIESDWARGNLESEVVLLEYADFQCPACASYHPLVNQLFTDYGDRVKFVFRHFPLEQIHANAEPAGRASEAAGRQGKFWEMHDMLFENQTAWANDRNAEEKFVEYAQALGLDVEQFRTDMNSDEAKNKVKNDYDGGYRSGVPGTPTFFLNGDKISNPRNYDEFKAVIDQALAQ